jgi:hypothetical protein
MIGYKKVMIGLKVIMTKRKIIHLTKNKKFNNNVTAVELNLIEPLKLNRIKGKLDLQYAKQTLGYKFTNVQHYGKIIKKLYKWILTD